MRCIDAVNAVCSHNPHHGGSTIGAGLFIAFVLGMPLAMVALSLKLGDS